MRNKAYQNTKKIAKKENRQMPVLKGTGDTSQYHASM